MHKHYVLVLYRTNITTKNKWQVVDQLSAFGLREAEKDFRKRNDFEKLLRKGDLSILESKKYYQ